MPRALAPRHSLSLTLTMILFAATLSGCAGFASVSESLFLMSADEEKKLGAEFGKQIEKEYPLLNDPQVVNYVRGVGQKIWANSGGGEIAPQFFVVKNKEVNAFAIPGGNVYVHTGLINAADDEAELAGVVGHEVGHVILRHGARNVSRAQGFELLQQLVLGQESGQAAQIASQILASGAMTRYSRQDEAASDEIAVATLHRMGYDPLALRSFFNKLLERYGENNNRLMSLFASHPPTSERMASVQAMVQSLPPKQYQRPTNDLRRIQARLKSAGVE